MGVLVDGKWQDGEALPTNAGGAFVRPASTFRDRVSRDGSTRFRAEPGRYHLFVASGCPWAHRTILYRRLKGLEDVIGITYSNEMGREGWIFTDGIDGKNADRIQPVEGKLVLHRIYTAADPSFTGRVTVPVLWDKATGTIVNNESTDIIRMLDWEFDDVGARGPHYFDPKRAEELDALSTKIYETVNNGVYRAGFARSQEAYETAAREVFATLDELDARLASRRFLFGSDPMEPDWRLFTTLVRFDVAYHYAFKCNLRKIADYPHLSGYLRDLYQWPGVKETVTLDGYKRGYFSIPPVNPSGIYPIGPIVDLDAPHDRDKRFR